MWIDHVNFTQATMKTIPCTSGRPRVICATNVNGQTCDGDSGSAVVGQCTLLHETLKYTHRIRKMAIPNLLHNNFALDNLFSLLDS